MKKQRPILFSKPMVEGLLDGRKVQTRRILRNQPVGDHDPAEYIKSVIDSCKYGQVGDELYVRETCLLWRDAQGNKSEGPIGVVYQTDSDYERTKQEMRKLDRKNDNWVVTPSIHTPKWASRILLEITDLRVERIQDISEKDCKEEGVQLVVDPTQKKLLWCVTDKFNPIEYLPRDEQGGVDKESITSADI